MTTQELDDLEASLNAEPLMPLSPPVGFEEGQQLICQILSGKKKGVAGRLVVSIHPDTVEECGFEDLDFVRMDVDRVKGVALLVALEGECETGASVPLKKVKGSGVLRWSIPCRGPVNEVFGFIEPGSTRTLGVIGSMSSKLFFNLPKPAIFSK